MAHVRSRDDGRAQSRPARSTPGEPGRAADRQAFAACFKRRSQLKGAWGRRPKGDAPRSEAGAGGSLAVSSPTPATPLLWEFLRCGGQTRTVSPVDVTAVRRSQLTYCVEVAAELLADVDEQTVRSVHQAQRPRRESSALVTREDPGVEPCRFCQPFLPD